jgi:hypothetical protein
MCFPMLPEVFCWNSVPYWRHTRFDCILLSCKGYVKMQFPQEYIDTCLKLGSKAQRPSRCYYAVTCSTTSTGLEKRNPSFPCCELHNDTKVVHLVAQSLKLLPRITDKLLGT